MTPRQHMQRANQALDSARLLMQRGNAEGACNRAYYAMFDAAKAALAAVEAPPDALRAKTHNGLRAAFNQYLIKADRLPAGLGSKLRRAEHLRLVADYIGDPISQEDLAALLADADGFLQAMQNRFEVLRESSE